MRGQRITPPQSAQPPDEIQITLTIEEAYTLAAIAATNASIPKVVAKFLGHKGFDENRVSEFLCDLKQEALFPARINLVF